jgi:hypothetical protein
MVRIVTSLVLPPSQHQLIDNAVTVGILALHYVTNDPTEKQLGMKQAQFNSKPVAISSVHSRAGGKSSATIVPKITTDTKIWASDEDGDHETVTAPDRIFVRTSYEVRLACSCDFSLSFSFNLFLSFVQYISLARLTDT